MCDAGLDDVGYWTEIKLNILREYAPAYTAILNKREWLKRLAYIDGFAGMGAHVSRTSGEVIEGSPAVALTVEPHFSHYHFIDLDGKRAAELRRLAGDRNDVTVYEGDCNMVLLEKVFPQCRYEDFCRALCLLDPYGLNPRWEVVKTAGQMKSIEILLTFMIMDANRNVLRRNPDDVRPEQIERMNAFWGDDSWRQAAYRKQPGLFGDIEEKKANEAVATAYRRRLKQVAGFKYVPEPLAMRNSKGATLYYLYFASHNETGGKIAGAVFKKWRKTMGGGRGR